MHLTLSLVAVALYVMAPKLLEHECTESHSASAAM
jgi:hypothetical protein